MLSLSVNTKIYKGDILRYTMIAKERTEQGFKFNFTAKEEARKSLEQREMMSKLNIELFEVEL
jgi:hypothetical protein